MYGLTADKLIGRTMREVVPQVADQIEASLDYDLAMRTLAEIKITVERPSSLGDTYPPEELIYLRSSQPVVDADGTVIGFSVALMDITKRERAEIALRESEENYRNTVDLNPHIPWTTDPSGKTLSTSPRFLTLTGLTAEQAQLQEWHQGLHPEDLDATWNAWLHSLETGIPYDRTYRLRDAAGTWRWVRARAFPRHSSSGKIVRWYGNLEDVHERKLLDEALQLKTVRLEEVSAQLSLLVREDHLTGLANRRHFDDAFARETARAHRGGLPLALIMIDVDRFKRFNDTYGHPAGDECLRAVAKALGKILRRQGDLAARYGGEEFVVLLPDTPEDGAVVVAQNALNAVRDLKMIHAGNDTGMVTISAGLAMLQPFMSRDVHYATELTSAADSALYAAKAAGRNCLVNAASLAGPERSSPLTP